MEVEHVFDEVYHGCGNDDEEDKQRQHGEESIENRVKEITERDLK